MTEAARPGAGWDCHVHVFDAARPARAGHYRPAHRPLAQIEAQAAALGVGHLVLVQPSVYGSDNSLLLEALAREPGRHRGVVVLDDDTDAATLDALHAAGVRGLRFNLVSPVGEGAAVEQRFDTWAPRLRRLGWHLQWYVSPEALPRVAALHAGSGLVAVLDHVAGLGPAQGQDASPAAALRTLAQAGAWVKLSGWYRLAPAWTGADFAPLVRAVAGHFGQRLVWGSDWPHTAFAADALPPYASLWHPVVDALGAPAADALLQGLPALYR